MYMFLYRAFFYYDYFINVGQRLYVIFGFSSRHLGMLCTPQSGYCSVKVQGDYCSVKEVVIVSQVGFNESHLFLL